MELKATIHKATVNIADMDRNYYSEANLVLAQHPSETSQRMILRLLEWLCHADDSLEFTRGLSAEDEPALWLHIAKRLNFDYNIDMSYSIDFRRKVLSVREKKGLSIRETAKRFHIGSASV